MKIPQSSIWTQADLTLFQTVLQASLFFIWCRISTFQEPVVSERLSNKNMCSAGQQRQEQDVVLLLEIVKSLLHHAPLPLVSQHVKENLDYTCTPLTPTMQHCVSLQHYQNTRISPVTVATTHTPTFPLNVALRRLKYLHSLDPSQF